MAFLRKAARLRMGEGSTLEEKLASIARTGFAGVDLILPSDVEPAILAETCSAAGLAVSNGLSLPTLRHPLAHPDPAVRTLGRDGLVEGLRACAALGTMCILVPSVLPQGTPAADGRALAIDELRTVLPVAEETGVVIGLENVFDGWMARPGEVEAVLDDLGSSFVGFYFDIGNAVPTGAPADFVHALKEQIVGVDAKDFSATRAREQGLDAGFEIELGGGDCVWEPVAEALRESDYRGWISAELAASGLGVLQRTNAALDRFFPDS